MSDEKEKEDEEELDEGEDEELAEAVEKVTKEIKANLNLDELREKIDKVIEHQKVSSKIYGESEYLKDKDMDNLSKEEKIVGFFHALVHEDYVTVKALSEGTAADGGLDRYSPIYM